jgi:hypothetical protein
MKFNKMKEYMIHFVIVFFMSACQIATKSNNGEVQSNKLNINDTFEIQLTDNLNTSYETTVYDVDLFDTDATTIQNLQSKNIKVICYFSAGSYEDWREDADLFPQNSLGNDLDGWVGEKWLDITNEEVKTSMVGRIQLASQKGCDGVDPDNVDGYTNDTGFALNYQDQLNYNKFLSTTAHEYNLFIGLKNDLNQIVELVDYFDFSINEQCHIYNECDLLSPFIEKSKPVFNIEYDEDFTSNIGNKRDLICEDSNNLGIHTIVMPHLLDGSFRIPCK